MVVAVVRQYTVDVGFTPSEIAAIFCEMDAHEQADFFSTVGLIGKSWPGIAFDVQASAIGVRCDENALYVLRAISGGAPE